MEEKHNKDRGVQKNTAHQEPRETIGRFRLTGKERQRWKSNCNVSAVLGSQVRIVD